MVDSMTELKFNCPTYKLPRMIKFPITIFVRNKTFFVVFVTLLMQSLTKHDNFLMINVYSFQGNEVHLRNNCHLDFFVLEIKNY